MVFKTQTIDLQTKNKRTRIFFGNKINNVKCLCCYFFCKLF